MTPLEKLHKKEEKWIIIALYSSTALAFSVLVFIKCCFITLPYSNSSEIMVDYKVANKTSTNALSVFYDSSRVSQAEIFQYTLVNVHNGNSFQYTTNKNLKEDWKFPTIYPSIESHEKRFPFEIMPAIIMFFSSIVLMKSIEKMIGIGTTRTLMRDFRNINNNLETKMSIETLRSLRNNRNDGRDKHYSPLDYFQS